ncbi:MAG TPA: galactokinase [Microbacterium sp.]|nr:galactokinase [Microbacterium sp.]HET6302938.1 galactokinase [Microbacterium sp.]
MLGPAARDARDLFAATIGGEPAGLWSAPGRVNLIGEHTDYNDGFVLPFAIDRRTYAAATRSAERRIRVASTLEAETVEVRLDELDLVFPDRREAVPEWARYPLGVASALLPERDADLPGVDVAIASDVPVGSGLSSSAAIECAVAAALDELWELDLDRIALARAGRLAENEAVGAPTGIMDQLAAMLGRADAAVFLDCRSLESEVIDLGFREQGLGTLVIDTGVTHSHATGGYRERREACEHGAAVMGVTALRDLSVDDLARAAELLDDASFRRVRHVVTENRRVLDTVEALRAHGPGTIGDLLLASHASMRDDFEISIPELDTAVETAVAAGAIGARMTGGGFGGAAIAVVPSESTKDVTDAVTEAFAASGFSAPRCFSVTPSDGARRDA